MDKKEKTKTSMVNMKLFLILLGFQFTNYSLCNASLISEKKGFRVCVICSLSALINDDSWARLLGLFLGI